MCRKLVVTNEIFLGTRAICYEAYSLPKGEVVELTEKQIKDALKGITTDEVYGRGGLFSQPFLYCDRYT